jgi:hypothetical protein
MISVSKISSWKRATNDYTHQQNELRNPDKYVESYSQTDTTISCISEQLTPRGSVAKSTVNEKYSTPLASQIQNTTHSRFPDSTYPKPASQDKTKTLEYQAIPHRVR